MIRNMNKAPDLDSAGRPPPPPSAPKNGVSVHHVGKGPRPPTHKGFVGSTLTVLEDGEVPAQKMRVFLMNNSYVDVDVNEQTVAGEICLTIRESIGIEADADCSLFSYTLGSYTVMQDDDVVLKKVRSWDMQDAEEGLSRLVQGAHLCA